MGCRCKTPQPKPMHGIIQQCDHCDPCEKAESNVRLCAFVVPTLEEGRYYKNSFVFVEEENAMYYISDDRSEIPFGHRPAFIDDFDPEAAGVQYKDTIIYDVKNQMSYVYGPDGEYVKVSLTGSLINAGEGITITKDKDGQTIAIDPAVVATQANLEAEAQARQLADSDLEEKLSQETANREQADSAEADARQEGDNNLQTQIDAIVASSDVKDVVGTKAELDSYDKNTLGDRDIIKVLQDETEDDATTYYRYNAATQSFSLIGEEGPYYTKAETDDKLNKKPVKDLSYSPTSDGVRTLYTTENLATGKTATVESPFPMASADGAGALKAADFKKFNDAAKQVETNTADISEALGQIAALDADKLGIENLLAGTGVTITKDGEGRETKLTINAESGAKELTEADYNWNYTTRSATEPYNCIAIWELDPGVYVAGDDWPQIIYTNISSTAQTIASRPGTIIMVSKVGNDNYRSFMHGNYGDLGTKETLSWRFGVASRDSGWWSDALTEANVVNDLNTTKSNLPLSANQGKVLKEMIESIPSGEAIKELTEADYNWNSTTGATGTPDCIAMWRLAPGLYSNPNQLKCYIYSGYSNPNNALYLIGIDNNNSYGVPIVRFSAYVDGEIASVYIVEGANKGERVSYYTIAKPVNDLNSTNYLAPLSANQGRILKEMIEAIPSGGGGDTVTHLTTADYNYPSFNPTGWAHWLAEPGIYVADELIDIHYDNKGGTKVAAGRAMLVLSTGEGGVSAMYTFTNERIYTYAASMPSGNRVYQDEKILQTNDITDNLTSSSAIRPLSANQGKILNDRLTALEEGGGSGVEVVQTTGTSTTAVMSQKAITDTLFVDNDPRQINIGGASDSPHDGRVIIGGNARALADHTTAIGVSSVADKKNSVALGYSSYAEKEGQVQIGAANDNYGHNGTRYRLLSGLYDPEDDHDAATKGYVDQAVADAGGSVDAYTKEEIGTKVVAEIDNASATTTNVSINFTRRALDTGIDTSVTRTFPMASAMQSGALTAADYVRFDAAANNTPMTVEEFNEAWA